jgi:5'-3' exonuclease
VIDFNCFLHKYLNADNPIGSIVIALEALLTETVRARQVYLAFDGLVPYAKMVQQRYRRMRRPEESSGFDKHQLSPGTPIMREIADTLRLLFPTISVSDTLDPGEGEHKMFQWLRTLPANDRQRICIYGLDADLVLIAIAQRRLGQMSVLRELEGGGFATLSIPALVQVLPMDPDEYVRMSILCFGNDFMPTLAMFSLREEGYSRAIYYATHGGILSAAPDERRILCKRAKETDRHILAPDGHALESRVALHCMDGVLNWDPVCLAFWKTYAWTLHYFTTSEVLDWKWVYPYPEAPLLETLVGTDCPTSFEWEAPRPQFTIEEHLQFILPKSSLQTTKIPSVFEDELYDEATETRHLWMKRFVWESDPYVSLPTGPLTTVGEYVLLRTESQRA